MANPTQQFNQALNALLKLENPLKLGNVTFSSLGPLGQTYDIPCIKWDYKSIVADTLAKLKQYNLIKQS